MNDSVRIVLETLDRRFGVDCLWVYGSEAAGRVSSESDLDLAVLFSSRPTSLELVELRAETSVLLDRRVDLVDLEEASPLLAYQVLRHGRLEVDRNPSRRHRFAALVPARREDVLFVRRPIEEQLLRRIHRGAAGG